jgi:hypothetical protein
MYGTSENLKVQSNVDEKCKPKRFQHLTPKYNVVYAYENGIVLHKIRHTYHGNRLKGHKIMPCVHWQLILKTAKGDY